MPCSRSNSNWCARNGRPATGRSTFGIFSVAGRNRVASPPARMATGYAEREDIQTVRANGKTPNTKHQTPNNLQSSNTKTHAGERQRSRRDCAFGVWKFVGVWCLVFGVFKRCLELSFTKSPVS